MATGFPTFTVGGTPDGQPAEIRPITSPSLYLDTSDLSYLLLGRLRHGVTAPVVWRDRLRAALAAGVVRLRISTVHLAELALRRDLTELGLGAIETTPNVFLVITSPQAVFEAELNRQPVAIAERAITADELRAFSCALKSWPWPLTGRRVAQLLKFSVRWEAWAQTSAKSAARGSSVERSTVLKMLRGDFRDIPPLTRPVARVLLGGLSRLGARFDTSLNVVANSIRHEEHGLSWAVSSTPNGHLPRRHNKGWNAEDARRMPATTLRASVEAVHANPQRLPDHGTRYDVHHLAYVAFSDFSTVDGAILDATKSARALLPHLQIFRTGHFERVLSAIERGVPPRRSDD